MEAKAPYEQKKPTASGCPYYNFSLSFHYQVLCYSSHGHVPPASFQSSTEMLSSPSSTTDSCSHVSPSERTPTPTPPQNGNEGRSTAGDEFGTDTSSFAEMLKFGWELISKLVRNERSVYKIQVLNEYKQADECICFFGLWLLLIV